MRKEKPYDKSVYRSLVLIMQFGINLLVPIGMLTALGIYLDQRFSLGYMTILLFFIGAIAGGQNIYRMAKQIYKTPNEKDKKEIDENHRSIKKEK